MGHWYEYYHDNVWILNFILVLEPPNQPSSTLQLSLQNSIAPITFSQEEDIDLAFSKLSASVTSTIEDTNFDRLQRAAIE